MSTWHAVARGALDLLLPAACVVCRRPHRPDGDGIVCQTCLARLVPLALPQCERCGHPRLSLAVPLPPARPIPVHTALAPDARAAVSGPVAALPSEVPLAPCQWCARLDPAIRAVRSVARMDTGTGADLVHALKYQGWTATSTAMGRRMARLSWPQDVLEERVAVVPLPLSSERLRTRGYNQAELLANAVAPRWRLPVWRNVLVRTRRTQSQVRLTPSERASNVSQAFAVPIGAQARVRGQHVVLVDDVVTTAATLNAAVQALLDGGARIISCVTFGRAPDPGDRATPDSDFTRN